MKLHLDTDQREHVGWFLETGLEVDLEEGTGNSAAKKCLSCPSLAPWECSPCGRRGKRGPGHRDHVITGSTGWEALARRHVACRAPR